MLIATKLVIGLHNLFPAQIGLELNYCSKYCLLKIQSSIQSIKTTVKKEQVGYGGFSLVIKL
jgi:hypothetical protein